MIEWPMDFSVKIQEQKQKKRWATTKSFPFQWYSFCLLARHIIIIHSVNKDFKLIRKHLENYTVYRSLSTGDIQLHKKILFIPFAHLFKTFNLNENIIAIVTSVFLLYLYVYFYFSIAIDWNSNQLILLRLHRWICMASTTNNNNNKIHTETESMQQSLVLFIYLFIFHSFFSCVLINLFAIWENLSSFRLY